MVVLDFLFDDEDGFFLVVVVFEFLSLLFWFLVLFVLVGVDGFFDLVFFVVEDVFDLLSFNFIFINLLFFLIDWLIEIIMVFIILV